MKISAKEFSKNASLYIHSCYKLNIRTVVFYIDFSFQDYIDLQVLNEGSLATENAAHLGELVETLVTTEREYSYLLFKNPKPQDSYGSWKQFAFFTDPQYSIFH